MKLSEKDKYNLDGLYWYYNNFPELSLSNLAHITDLDRTTLGKYYSKKYGMTYKILAKSKNKIKNNLSQDVKDRISLKLIGKKKPPRSQTHKINLSLAFKGKSFEQRFGKVNADKIREILEKKLR